MNDAISFLFPSNGVGLLIANSFFDSVAISISCPVIGSSFAGVWGPGPSSVSGSVSGDGSQSLQVENDSRPAAVVVSFDDMLL